MRFLLFTLLMKNDFEGVKNVHLIIDHDQYPVSTSYQIFYV